MGDNYGPMVVAREAADIDSLRGKKIAVPGTLTTAFLSLKLLLGDDFEHEVHPFDEILNVVEAGGADAGLIIHEGQLTYQNQGLHLIVDMGKWWMDETGLPLPLGANAIRKDLGQPAMDEVTALLKESIQYGLDHRKEALEYALQFGRDLDRSKADEFVGMYVNDWTLDFGERGREAVATLLRRGYEAGDIDATVGQVTALEQAGADVVRIAVDSRSDAEALKEIRKQTSVSLSVDLQENYRLAEIVAPYVDKLRYNPGHLYHHEREKPWREKVRYLAGVAADNDCAMRVGVNCGSVDPAMIETHGSSEDELAPMLTSALEHCQQLDDLGFHRYCVSLKDSDPAKVIEANERFSGLRPDVPLHLGVTEAGMPPDGVIKTRIAFEQLVSKGIGDTIRVSLTVSNDRKREEIEAGRQILKDISEGRVRSFVDFGLDTLNIISCPSCSRVENEAFIDLAEKVREMTSYAKEHAVTIAVMGCRVNGPGETDDADLGLWRMIAAAVLVLVSGSPLLADGVVRDSVGAISSGRGGTNLGYADNGAILLNNPAAMVNIRGRMLSDFGIDTIVSDLDYADPENSRAAKYRAYPLPTFSYIERSEDSMFAAGIGVYAPAGFGAQWSLQNPILGRNRYESFAAVAKVLPAVAVQLSDRLSVGANLGVAISHTDLESPFFLQTGPLAGTPTLFNLQASGAAPTWAVGMQYQISDRTTFGLAYSSETRFNLDGNVAVDIVGLGPAPIHSRFDLDMDMAWPSSLGFGIVHQLTCAQRVSLDVVFFNWSETFDKIDMRLSRGTNPIVTALAGPVIRDSLALNWKDSVSVRLGYEIDLSDCDTLRAGYVHNSESTPSSTLTPLIPATLEHTMTIGYGKRWCNWSFDFAYQYAVGPNRRVTTSDIVGGDFNFSKVKANTHWTMFSVTKTY
eukprot:g26572.t1